MVHLAHPAELALTPHHDKSFWKNRMDYRFSCHQSVCNEQLVFVKYEKFKVLEGGYELDAVGSMIAFLKRQLPSRKLVPYLVTSRVNNKSESI